jgi:hypothetical protein
MGWLLQGLLSNWLSAVIILAGGALIAYLKQRSSSWLGPAVWGIGGCVLVAIALLCFWGIAAIPKTHPPDVTDKNIEQNIRGWLDDFGLSTKKQQDEPTTIFTLVTTLPNGDPIAIGQLKTHPRYLTIQSTVTISPEHKSVIDKLSKVESDELVAQVNLEMARAKVSNIMTSPLGSVVLVSRLPITSDLTEDEFMRHIDDMDSDISIVRDTVQLRVAAANRVATK